jgi:broad specificity phosphatase PhoE
MNNSTKKKIILIRASILCIVLISAGISALILLGHNKATEAKVGEIYTIETLALGSYKDAPLSWRILDKSSPEKTLVISEEVLHYNLLWTTWGDVISKGGYISGKLEEGLTEDEKGWIVAVADNRSPYFLLTPTQAGLLNGDLMRFHTTVTGASGPHVPYHSRWSTSWALQGINEPDSEEPYYSVEYNEITKVAKTNSTGCRPAMYIDLTKIPKELISVHKEVVIEGNKWIILEDEDPTKTKLISKDVLYKAKENYWGDITMLSYNELLEYFPKEFERQTSSSYWLRHSPGETYGMTVNGVAADAEETYKDIETPFELGVRPVITLDMTKKINKQQVTFNPPTAPKNYIDNFTKGTNILWFQGKKEFSSSEVPALTTPYITQEYISTLASMGMDTMRIPISREILEENNKEIQEEKRMKIIDKLDDLVTYCGVAKINIILDAAHFNATSAEKEVVMEANKFLANRYKDYDEHVFYEIINEPSIDGGNMTFQKFQKDILAEIRKIDKKHTVVLTGGGGTPGSLYQAVANDPNVVYTFHDYTPTVYTHQANGVLPWGTQPYSVPFPLKDNGTFYTKEIDDYLANLDTLYPGITEEQKGAIQSAMEDYYKGKTIVNQIENNMKNVAKIAEFTNAKIYMGEFDCVWRDQVNYPKYAKMRVAFAKKYNIAYTCWFLNAMWGEESLKNDRKLYEALGMYP